MSQAPEPSDRPPAAGDLPPGPGGPPPGPPRLVRAPSARVTAVLAAVMLAAGVAVGAAIGPAPAASLGQGLPLPQLLPKLLAAAGVGRQPSASAAATTAAAPVAQPALHKRKRRRKHLGAASGEAAAGASETSTPSSTLPETSTPSSAPSTPTSAGKPQRAVLAPVTNVWLIELSGSTFAGALAAPAAAPYITGQALPAGTLLSGWSGLDGSALASEAALLGGKPPQILDTILQPACPEGAAGASCAAGTPGALSAADAFLAQTLPTITSTAAYRASGLIVVTFGSVAAGAASGLPGGSTTATLTAEPPAGVLLISPFATAGSRSAAAFDPSSPTQSLAKVLHK
jgi:hypothetical protein